MRQCSVCDCSAEYNFLLWSRRCRDHFVQRRQAEGNIYREQYIPLNLRFNLPPCNVRFNNPQHVNGCFVEFHKCAIENLTQAKKLQYFANLGTNAINSKSVVKHVSFQYGLQTDLTTSYFQ